MVHYTKTITKSVLIQLSDVAIAQMRGYHTYSVASFLTGPI